MSFRVIFSELALADLEDISDYIQAHDSSEAAHHVVTNILNVCETLAELPNRGTIPAGLKNVGVLIYREIFFKPYQVIYLITDDRVEILLIADGRRDMQTLLLRRLLSLA